MYGLIVHGSKKFDDRPLRPYSFTRRLIRNYYEDECEIFLVSGMPEGIGKSGYVHHVLADIQGYQKCRDKEAIGTMWMKAEDRANAKKWPSDWPGVKPLVKYLPQDVVKMCKERLLKGIRDVAFHWDDAGTWLYIMEYHDPFIIAFMEYLPLARSNWGGVILSTAVEEWVLKKLQTSEGILKVRITKQPGAADRRYIWKPRLARCYKKIRYPGATRSYWPKQFEDRFIAIMPDDFFRWYKPIRDRYTLLAALKMEQALKKRKARGWNVSVAEELLEEMKESVARANDEVPDFREVIAQKTQEEH